MPKNKTTNPRATEMMNAALGLRARQATLQDANREALRLYPDDSKTDAAHRARLRRFFGASESDLERAAKVLHAGGNLNEVIAELSPLSARGAPVGNDNGKAKRQTPIIEDLNRLWQLADMDTRSAFMRAQRLHRK